MEKIKDSEMGSFFYFGVGRLGDFWGVIWGGKLKNYFCLFLARNHVRGFGVGVILKIVPPVIYNFFIFFFWWWVLNSFKLKVIVLN